MYSIPSPTLVEIENVSVVELPGSSETVVEFAPSPGTSSVTVCVSETPPVLVTVAVTSISSPSNGAFVPSIATVKLAGSNTVTGVLAVSFALVTVAV